VRLLVLLSLALNALLILVIIRQWRHRIDLAQDAVGWHLYTVRSGSITPIESLAESLCCSTVGRRQASKAVARLRRKGRVNTDYVVLERHGGKVPPRTLVASLTPDGRKQIQSGIWKVKCVPRRNAG
jgi:hypothetical protein